MVRISKSSLFHRHRLSTDFHATSDLQMLSRNTWRRRAWRRAPDPPSPRCHKCSPKNKSCLVEEALRKWASKIVCCPSFSVSFSFSCRIFSSDVRALRIEQPLAVALFFSLSAIRSFACSVMIKSFTRHYITCSSASAVGLISRLYELVKYSHLSHQTHQGAI